MAKKGVDLGKISTNPDASGGLRKHSIGEVISSSSSVTSTGNEKPLPHYMRASTSSCHDICKYGRKHDFESESTYPFLQKSRIKLNLAEGRKMHEIKLNSSSHVKNEVPGRLAMSKVKGTNLGDQTKKQVVKTKTVAFSNKNKVDGHLSPSPDKGIEAVQISGIIKKNTPLLEATSSTKLAKKTSLKNYTTQNTLPNPKHRSSVPEEMNKVDAKYVASRKVSKTSSVAPGSPFVSPWESIEHGKNKKKIINSREITKTPEMKMRKSSIACVSLKHVGDSISSLKQRKHKDGEEATPMKDPMVEKSEHDTENNKEKTLQVTDEISDKVDTDSSEQKSLEIEKVLSVEPPLKCEIGDLDSLQQILLKPENVDMGIPEKNIHLDSHDSNADSQRLLEVKNDNTILLDQNVLNPEKVDIDSLEGGPDGLRLLEPENDINSQDKNLPKLLDFESLELEPTSQNLLGLENGKTDVLEQKLLTPEDLDLDFPEQKLPEQGTVNMNSLEQKMLELEGVDLDSLVLEHNGQKLPEQQDAEMNSLGQKLLEPEGIVGLDSLALKHNNQKLPEQENAEMNSLEKKLPEPQDMDLDSLELKHNDQKLLEEENVGMSSPEQTLLKPVNTDLDSPDHGRLAKFATDEEEEIEESESYSSETAESEREHGVKEVKGDHEPLKTEERRRARRKSVVHPEDNTSVPHKLKFRRGKTIELQTESNGPRRLRFRRRRMVDVSVDSMNIERKNFRRSEMTEEVPGSGPEAQSIVLKHQGAQEKKDAKGLFNNVIEETASKLVETRKSKVKALVGAFETVISLQDSKQESTT